MLLFHNRIRLSPQQQSRSFVTPSVSSIPRGRVDFFRKATFREVGLCVNVTSTFRFGCYVDGITLDLIQRAEMNVF